MDIEGLTGLSGLGTEGFILFIFYLIVRYIIYPLIRRSTRWQKYQAKRTNNGTATQRIRIPNPGPPPGQADECIKHGKLLTELDTKLNMFMDSCEKEFKRINGNIKDLSDKYDRR